MSFRVICFTFDKTLIFLTMNKKTVLITGGTRGLGKKIAEIFLKNDYNIVLAARNIYDCNFPKDFFKFIKTDVRKIRIIQNGSISNCFKKYER